MKVLNDVNELLKPGGTLYFIEHVAERKNSWIRTFQNLMNPWWVVVSDGCNCNRDTLENIKSIKDWDVKPYEVYIKGFPLIERLHIGYAVKKNNKTQLNNKL